jgi:carbon storage regulator
MLVLTRKYQEKVHIGDGITITVLRTKGKAVRLGIEAPVEVPVIRGELAFNESPVSVAEKAETVTHHRVSRDEAAEILPRLLCGEAPLRDLCRQRSKAD